MRGIHRSPSKFLKSEDNMLTAVTFDIRAQYIFTIRSQLLVSMMRTSIIILIWISITIMELNLSRTTKHAHYLLRLPEIDKLQGDAFPCGPVEIYRAITGTSHECHGVSDHRSLECVCSAVCSG